MSIETFGDAQFEIDNLRASLNAIFARLDAIEALPDQSAAMAELTTQVGNISARLAGVEERLTARETAHMAILQQQTDLIQQLTAKLQGVLEVKPEIMPYEYELAKGVLDSVTGHRLRADATAQRKFTGQLLMVFILVSSGQIPSNHPVGFWTYDGARHELPASEYMGMIIRYGMGIAAIEEAY